MKKLISLITLFLCLSAQSQTVSNVNATEFKKQIDSKKGVLIDLRTTEEIKSKGMIPGAMQIDFLAKDAETQIAGLDKKKTYLIYCAGGGRSGDCAELMQKSGFKEVVNLEKGFSDWTRNGLPVEIK